MAQGEAELNDTDLDGSEPIDVDQDEFVEIAGETIKLPTIPLGASQPAKDKDVTAWFLANAKVYKGSSKIFEVKSKPVCTVVYSYVQWYTDSDNNM